MFREGVQGYDARVSFDGILLAERGIRDLSEFRFLMRKDLPCFYARDA